MKKVTVYTRDALLYRRLSLLFGEEYDFCRLTEGDEAPTSDTVIVDTDSCPTALGGDILLSKNAEQRNSPSSATILLTVPFAYEDMENALKSSEKRDTGRLVLLTEERAVRLDGVTVKLTDVEFRLLCTLMSVPVGEYVSRQKIITEVWGDGVDSGVVNVYVHYLREKLEKNGEKIIISSRNLGYKINERTVTVC